MTDKCIACGRTDVKRKPLFKGGPPAGKQRVRHKCPHGVWCVAGVLNHGFNGPLLGGPNYCAECVKAAGR